MGPEGTDDARTRVRDAWRGVHGLLSCLPQHVQAHRTTGGQVHNTGLLVQHVWQGGMAVARGVNTTKVGGGGLRRGAPDDF